MDRWVGSSEFYDEPPTMPTLSIHCWCIIMCACAWDSGGELRGLVHGLAYALGG